MRLAILPYGRRTGKCVLRSSPMESRTLPSMMAVNLTAEKLTAGRAGNGRRTPRTHVEGSTAMIEGRTGLSVELRRGGRCAGLRSPVPSGNLNRRGQVLGGHSPGRPHSDRNAVATGADIGARGQTSAESAHPASTCPAYVSGRPWTPVEKSRNRLVMSRSAVRVRSSAPLLRCQSRIPISFQAAIESTIIFAASKVIH